MYTHIVVCIVQRQVCETFTNLFIQIENCKSYTPPQHIYLHIPTYLHIKIYTTSAGAYGCSLCTLMES